MPPSAYSDISYFVMSHLERYPWLKQQGLPLIGVGGTARTVAKIVQRSKKYPTTKLHNYALTAQTFRAYFNKLRDSNLEQRKKISGLSNERSDIILAGYSIINCLFEITNSKKLIVSGCGLREGLFFDYYYKAHDLPVVADNILERSRENILKLYTPDTSHSKHITALALNMFDSWPKLHGVNKSHRKLLETAALLHDIGITINFYSHARHSAYMIQNAQLFGLTHKEQVITAAIAGWHNGASKSYFKDKFYKEMLDDEDWVVINKLALLLALAESLDYSQTNQINNISPYLDKRGAVIKIFADDIPSIEMHQIKGHQAWFRKIFNTELTLELANESK